MDWIPQIGQDESTEHEVRNTGRILGLSTNEIMQTFFGSNTTSHSELVEDRKKDKREDTMS